ncbi:amidase domain-containing protein [bacterium 210820-DFI.6.37]|nr:amidase domain-containing protein [bacterium 210820-DFI.6.37]
MIKKKMKKPVIITLIVTLILSMTSIGVYANDESEPCETIESIEQEVENYLAEQRPEIEVGSESYIEYLFDLLTFEDDDILAESEYYEQIKIYASEYLSQLNNPDTTEESVANGETIIELTDEEKAKTIDSVIDEAKTEDAILEEISIIKDPIYSTQASYSDSKAVNYAKKYGNSYNSQYNKYSADCTNFVSQCVKAGGKSMTKPSTIPTGVKDTTKYWYSVRYLTGNNEMHYNWKESSSFIRVSDFYTYWKNKGITTASYSTKTKLQNGAAIGDVVQLKNGNGKWYHSIIITGGSKGNRTYSGHSNNCVNKQVSKISGAVSYRALKF